MTKRKIESCPADCSRVPTKNHKIRTNAEKIQNVRETAAQRKILVHKLEMKGRLFLIPAQTFS